MSFIRKNKFVIIAIEVFLILVVLVFQIATMFFPEEGTALYGDRLDGIEEVELSNSKLTKIESNLKSDGAVKEADVRMPNGLVTRIKDHKYVLCDRFYMLNAGSEEVFTELLVKIILLIENILQELGLVITMEEDEKKQNYFSFHRKH